MITRRAQNRASRDAASSAILVALRARTVASVTRRGRMTWRVTSC
ncbi:hypothetical protein [Streptomyces sp. NPDC050485]